MRIELHRMHNTTTIPPCFYRVSVKALILDETRTKFLVVQDVFVICT